MTAGSRGGTVKKEVVEAILESYYETGLPIQVATSLTQHLPTSYLIKFWSQNQKHKQNQNKTFWLISLLLLLLILMIISHKAGVKT